MTATTQVDWFQPEEMLEYVNDARKGLNSPPLQLDPQVHPLLSLLTHPSCRTLCKAAENLALHQATVNTLTHDGPTGTKLGKRVSEFGFKWQHFAENVGFGFLSEKEAVESWLHSPPHRKNLLEAKFTTFGAAVAQSPCGLVYLTQEFAKPLGCDSNEEKTEASAASVLVHIKGLVNLVNAERGKIGLAPVHLDFRLCETSHDLAVHMAATKTLTPIGPDGKNLSDRAKQYGFDFASIGENLCLGPASEAEVFQQWISNPMNSKTVLTPGFTRMGVGCAHAPGVGYYWVADFGSLLHEKGEFEEEVVLETEIKTLYESGDPKQELTTTNVEAATIPIKVNTGAGSSIFQQWAQTIQQTFSPTTATSTITTTTTTTASTTANTSTANNNNNNNNNNND